MTIDVDDQNAKSMQALAYQSILSLSPRQSAAQVFTESRIFFFANTAAIRYAIHKRVATLGGYHMWHSGGEPGNGAIGQSGSQIDKRSKFEPILTPICSLPTARR